MKRVQRKPDRQALASLNRILMVAAGLCVVMTSVMVLPSLFIRQTETVMIARVDTARECRSQRSLFLWSKFRSSQPQFSHSYCGLVMSDHGSFDLPETTWINLIGLPRETIHDRLVIGCKYRIVVAGPGLALKKGGAMSNSNRTLRSAIPLGDCAAQGGV